jgi:hypothetical protein
LEVQSLHDSLSTASTAEDCWTAVQRNSSRFGFEVVRMRLGNQVFGSTEPAGNATIRVAISDQDWVDLLLDTDLEKQPNVLLPFVSTIQKTITDKGLSFAEEEERATLFTSAFHEAASSTIQ